MKNYIDTAPKSWSVAYKQQLSHQTDSLKVQPPNILLANRHIYSTVKPGIFAPHGTE